MRMRHIDTIDPDVYVQIGWQYYRAQDIFGEPDKLVELRGACRRDEKDKEG